MILLSLQAYCDQELHNTQNPTNNATTLFLLTLFTDCLTLWVGYYQYLNRKNCLTFFFWMMWLGFKSFINSGLRILCLYAYIMIFQKINKVPSYLTSNEILFWVLLKRHNDSCMLCVLSLTVVCLKESDRIKIMQSETNFIINLVNLVMLHNEIESDSSNVATIVLYLP